MPEAGSRSTGAAVVGVPQHSFAEIAGPDLCGVPCFLGDLRHLAGHICVDVCVN